MRLFLFINSVTWFSGSNWGFFTWRNGFENIIAIFTWLNVVRDSAESSSPALSWTGLNQRWALFRTALSQAEFYLRQRWVKQKAMGFLNRQLLSKKITYPGQRCVKLSAVLNITESSLWLSRIAPSHILWSKNNTYLDGVYFFNTYYYNKSSKIVNIAKSIVNYIRDGMMKKIGARKISCHL